MYSVDVEFDSAYELVASLTAYTSRNLSSVVDLGKKWRAGVRERLSFDPSEMLAELEKSPLETLGLVRLSPNKDVEGFIAWLSTLSLGDLYGIAATLAPGLAIPPASRLEDGRSNLVRLVEAWHRDYFGNIDARILAGLRADAAEKAAAVTRCKPSHLVAWATGGIHLAERPGLTRVILVPQHHCRPWNLYAELGGDMIYHYPAESIEVGGSDIPPRTIRLARALSDESRLRILRFLGSDNQYSFTDVVRQSGLSKSTVHHHMTILRAAGLVSVYVDGSGADRYHLRENACQMVGETIADYLEGK